MTVVDLNSFAGNGFAKKIQLPFRPGGYLWSRVSRVFDQGSKRPVTELLEL